MRLHRFILNLGRNDPEADHINRNPWDNRKCNLRLATRSQNCANATKQKGTLSQFKGVRYHEGRWKARITAGGKMHIGTFDSEIEAARAYDCKAREIYGEFAAVNFPNSHLEPPVKMGRNFGIKRCKHCGNTFTPYVRRHTYCKTKCRLASKGCK